MAQNLTIHYDNVGDILFIDQVAPYAEQDSDQIGEDVVARFNPVTRSVETLEILFFSETVMDVGRFDLPISGDLRLSE